MTFFNSRFDEVDERGNVTFQLTSLNSRRYGAAAFMSKHDKQRNLQVLGSILETSQFGIRCDISSDSDNKQISKTLVENNLRWDSRIRATQNLGVWMLTG